MSKKKTSNSSKEKIYLSELDEVQILWPGDIRALAEFLLRCYDAKNLEDNARHKNLLQTTRSTLHGLAVKYAYLSDIPLSRIEDKFKEFGFYLGAIVEYDPTPNGTD